MGGIARRRRTVRRWLSYREGDDWVEAWDKRPEDIMGLCWEAAGEGPLELCHEDLEALGIYVPSDRPVLVEFSAKVVDDE